MNILIFPISQKGGEEKKEKKIKKNTFCNIGLNTYAHLEGERTFSRSDPQTKPYLISIKSLT